MPCLALRSPFASHLIYAQPGILDDGNPEERALGIKAGLVWARSADDRIFFTDYGWSDGMKKAANFYDENVLEWRAFAIGTNPDERCPTCAGLGIIQYTDTDSMKCYRCDGSGLK